MRVISVASLFFPLTGVSAFTLSVGPVRSTPTMIRAPMMSNDDAGNVVNSSEEEDSSESSSITRRSAMSKSAQSLAALLLTNSIIIPTDAALADIIYPSPSPKTIVMTGCNSGIGYDAAKRMAKQGHTIILACRSFSKANDAATRIQTELAADAGAGAGDPNNTLNLKLIPKECNLADLTSIKSFVQELTHDNIKIDALCLNAGIARNTAAKDVLRTAQGFELTIGTNHLGHFYLTHEIMSLPVPMMQKGGRIVVTASGVHDPDSPGGAQGSKATLGDLAGLRMAVSNGNGVFDMVDGGEYDADKAYKDSKLCNVFFMKELQKRLDAGGMGIEVNAFNPGLIVSTGLFRDQNPLFTKLFDFAATDLLKVGESVHWGGGALEFMTLNDGVGSKGGLYYTSPPGSSKYGDAAFGTQFAVTDVSLEGKNDAKGKLFWELSEQLVGISV